MAAKRQFNVFSSAARTTHTSSADIFLQEETGVRLDIDITAFSGTSITFTVEYWDTGKGAYLTLLASAALSANGHTVLTIDPRMAAAANVTLNAIPPKRIRVTPSGTITSVTYSVMFTGGF